MKVTVTGIERAQDALEAALREINIESEMLLNQMLQGIAQHTAPYVPVNTSMLINSEFRTTDMTPTGPVGTIGYNADYAHFVHDGPQKNWQKAGASNLFLELGVRDYIADSLAADLARFGS